MLIALLALLGVNLAALLALAASVVTRKRWIKRQPGAFRGAIRVADGEIDRELVGTATNSQTPSVRH